jgi:hypothetical protein
MWANTCWGFLTLTVGFALARLSMIWTVGHEEWGPRLLWAAGICFVLSMSCFLWPLLKRREAISLPQPNMSIADVTNYMVNDSAIELKKPKLEEIQLFGPAKGKLLNWWGIGHQDALTRVQTALNNGTLDAWGCRELKPGTNAMSNFEQWQRPIPKEYWKSAYLNSLLCMHTTNREAQTESLPGHNVEHYTGVMMNKRQVLSLYPSNASWRRILADLRFIRRKNYFGKDIDHHYQLIDPYE